MISRVGQKILAGRLHATLGIAARIIEKSPLLQPRGHRFIIRSLWRAALNPRLIQRLHRIGIPPLACPRFGDLHLPLRVAVAQLVELLVICNRIVQLVETLFQIRLQLIQVLLFRPHADRFSVSLNGRRIILQRRLQPGQHNAPASVARRGLHCLTIKSNQLRAQPVRACRQRGLLRQSLVFGVGVDQLEVLIRRAIPVAQQAGRIDDAAPQLGYPLSLFAALHGGGLHPGQLRAIKRFQPRLIAGARVVVRQRRFKAGIHRLLAQQRFQ